MGKLQVSQRRIDANRRNALKSTGPKTDEGKANSRRNGLIHGLAGAGVVLPRNEEQAVRDRSAQLYSSLRPMNAFEEELLETAAVEAVRLDRCRIEERFLRDVLSRRAVACWFDERRAEAATLGQALAGQPETISARLGTTAEGCDWLIVRWRALGKTLDAKGDWTEAQRSLALDLLGVPADIREMDNPLEPPEGVGEFLHWKELVNGELNALLDRKQEELDPLDEDLREGASMGLLAADDPKMVLLRRYETAALRRQRWAVDQIKKGRQRPAPVPAQTREYRERERDTSSIWYRPYDHPEDMKPEPETEPERTPPDGPGGDPSDCQLNNADRHRSAESAVFVGPPSSGPAMVRPDRPSRPASQTGQIPVAGPIRSAVRADRTHLAGLLRRLAIHLAGFPSNFSSSKPRFRPRIRRTRPAIAQSRRCVDRSLRLISPPAA